MSGTIQQIADLAGVSRGTVDRVLNDRGRVNPEVAAKIFEIAESIAYQPKKRKVRKTRQKGHKIGVITQLSKSGFMDNIRQGIEDASYMLSQIGIETIVKEIDTLDEEAQHKCIEELLKEGIEGLAIMPTQSELIRGDINGLVEAHNIPVVTFNSDVVGTKRTCFVGMDNRKSGLTAAGLMGLLTGGTGKILIITGFFSHNVNSLRVDGFVEEIKKSFPEMELLGVQSSFDETTEVESIAKNALTNFPDLKGIFIASSGASGLKNVFETLDLEQRPAVVIYDKTNRNTKLLENNQADFLIDQDLYAQGYQPLLILKDLLRFGKQPAKECMYTNINIRTKYNL